MQQVTNQKKEDQTIDYFESFLTIQQLNALDSIQKDQFIGEGFTIAQVQNLMDIIDIDTPTLCFILNISGFEFKEVLQKKVFSNEMCHKIIAVAEIYGLGYSIFKGRMAFNHWMKSEIIGRGIISNLSYLCCPEGIQEVIRIIRIECDVYF